jgi:transposase
MNRHFRPWKIDQTQLLPPAIADYVPEDHLSRFVVALARESLELSEVIGSYKSGLGQPPFDPRMMVALLLYAYCSGLFGEFDAFLHDVAQLAFHLFGRIVRATFHLKSK